MNRQIILGIIILILCFCLPEFAIGHHQKMRNPPQVGERILLMRHAEKPKNSDPNLAPAGFERARQLVPFVLNTFGRPDYIFAAANSKDSDRPYETATPLAQASGVPINTAFADKDYKELAKMLLHDPRFQGKLVVIVWHHGDIPRLAHCLKAKDGSYPSKWKSSIYNQFLQFDYTDKHHPIVTMLSEPF